LGSRWWFGYWKYVGFRYERPWTAFGKRGIRRFARPTVPILVWIFGRAREDEAGAVARCVAVDQSRETADI
jgi:hypothetical protein